MSVVDIYTTDNRYGTILIDPPWRFRNRERRDRHRGGTEYPTMSIRQIKRLPVRRLTADGCELWLWSTNAHLHSAFHIIKAWGFDYQGLRVWAKPRMGVGHWLRGQTELLLFATYGTPRKRRRPSTNGRRIHTVRVPSTLITTRDILPHSRKPRESYEDIERVSPEPRLELFARRPRKGWDSWGFDAAEYDEEFASDLDANLV